MLPPAMYKRPVKGIAIESMNKFQQVTLVKALAWFRWTCPHANLAEQRGSTDLQDHSLWDGGVSQFVVPQTERERQSMRSSLTRACVAGGLPLHPLQLRNCRLFRTPARHRLLGHRQPAGKGSGWDGIHPDERLLQEIMS